MGTQDRPSIFGQLVDGITPVQNHQKVWTYGGVLVPACGRNCASQRGSGQNIVFVGAKSDTECAAKGLHFTATITASIINRFGKS